MSRLNYSRPIFRTQGRETIDIHEEREQEKRARKFLQKHLQKPNQKPKEKHKRPHQPQLIPQPFDLVAAVERDVREIATDIFFDTPDAVRAEVDRRLAWHRSRGLVR